MLILKKKKKNWGGGGGGPEMYALDVRVRDPKIAAEFGERTLESEA